MAIWLRQRSFLSLHWLEVHYEDLVVNLDNTVRQILEFLGVTFDPIVFNFHESNRNRYISTPSYHAVTKPVYQSSIGRWKPYKRFFSDHLSGLKPFLETYGYR